MTNQSIDKLVIYIYFPRKRQPDRSWWRRSTTRWTSSRRITLASSTPTTTTSVTGWTRPNPSRNKSKVSLRAVSPVASRHYLKILYFQLDLRTPSECESSSILLNQTALERKLQGKPGVSALINVNLIHFTSLRHSFTSRYQFFLQLKLDLLSGRLECPYATSVELAALSLQCEFNFRSQIFLIQIFFSWTRWLRGEHSHAGLGVGIQICAKSERGIWVGCSRELQENQVFSCL